MSQQPLLDFGELIDEATERAGLDPSSLTHDHLQSINRSMRLLLVELEIKGPDAEFRQESRAFTLAPGDGGVALDADIIDVDQVVLSLDNKPTPLSRSHRNDFLNLSFPTAAGPPSSYFLAKTDLTGDIAIPSNVLVPPAGPNTPVIVLWPQTALVGVISAEIQVSCTRQHRSPSLLSDTLDSRRSWFPTLVAGLAFHIARKWNPNERDRLQGDYKEELGMATAEENHHPVSIGWRAHGFGRARRH